MPDYKMKLLSGLALTLTLTLTAIPAVAERPSAGCGSAVPASGVYQIADGALTRTYNMHVPAGLAAASPAPLALIFHGWGGDENEFLSDPVVTSEADRLGFILVAPRGVGTDAPDNSFNSWTFDGSATGIGGDGQPICSGAETDAKTNYAYASCGPEGTGVAQNGCSWTQCQTDDLAFVQTLIDEIGKTACIDLDRIFAAGGSNGGMFTWELGQTGQTAMALRAIAPIIGLPHQGDLEPPARPDGLPVLVITGNQDPTVPPGAWEDPAPSTTADADLYHYTGATGITRVWAEALSCNTDVAAASVDFGAEGMDCRSYCAADASGLQPVLDCRAEMAHDYDFAKTWPMVLDFFNRQPPR
jgi:poly(3-hydroxybutyrate) depolymerase